MQGNWLPPDEDQGLPTRPCPTKAEAQRPRSTAEGYVYPTKPDPFPTQAWLDLMRSQTSTEPTHVDTTVDLVSQAEEAVSRPPKKEPLP